MRLTHVLFASAVASLSASVTPVQVALGDTGAMAGDATAIAQPMQSNPGQPPGGLPSPQPGTPIYPSPAPGLPGQPPGTNPGTPPTPQPPGSNNPGANPGANPGNPGNAPGMNPGAGHGTPGTP
jgi:hypothetical protein